MSGGGHTISLGDYNEEWRAHRRLVHSALQRCCQQSLHDVIERQALHLRKVQKTQENFALKYKANVRTFPKSQGHIKSIVCSLFRF